LSKAKTPSRSTREAKARVTREVGDRRDVLGLVNLALEEFAFDRPQPGNAPAGHGHVLDQGELGFGLGVVLTGEIGE
jgi:hypothetical protein